jgi:diacylglycerol O-acyltransferase / wax synthase
VKQLSMTDAFMLSVETDKQKIQMASVSILAPAANGQRPVTREALRDLVAERIHLAPALHRKLMRVPLGLDFPYWVNDSDIDLDYHVRAFALPSPGDDRALSEAVGRLVSEAFDHARPLWQLYVIEGLKDRRVAVMFKLHHAVVDGISGLDLHTMLFDHSPAGRDVPAPRDQVAGVPSRRELLVRAIRRVPIQILRVLLGGIRSLPYLDQLMPFRVVPGVGLLAGTIRWLARLVRLGGEGMLIEGQGLKAPKTALDHRVTSNHRSWAFARTALEEAKRVKNHYGVTLNDVVVATTAGAIRQLLAGLNEAPEEPLVALIPISVRSEDAESHGNLVQVMFIELPTNEADPEKRLLETHLALRAAKERHHAVPATAMRGADELLMPALFIRASQAATLLSSVTGVMTNVVISNVPGPAVPVYIAGARVEALYPVGGVIEGFGFSTIVFSYCTDLQVGFTFTKDSPADPWRLVEAYERSHRELLALADSSGQQQFLATPPPDLAAG